MQEFKYKKAIQALNYFSIKSGGRLNKMKAIKLIWLSDRYHLRQFGRTITGDFYFAMPFGPVASTTRDILEVNTGLSEVELEYSNDYIEITSKYEFESKNEVHEKVFSKTDINVLDVVFEAYKNMNHFELSELSHSYPEWLRYKSSLDRRISSRFEIDREDFFKNMDDGKGLFLDNDEYIAISKDIFLQKSL